jgi:hypothetical protein
MNTIKFNTKLLTIFVILLLAALACQAGTRPIPTGIPQIPTALPSLPTLDPNLSNNFEEEWQKALADVLANGTFNVTVTEGQISEFINRENAENPEATSLSNIQVFLRDGQVQIISDADTEAGSATLQITATVAVTAEGTIQFNVVSAQLGIFPVPESLLSSISQSVNDALNGQIAGAENVQVQSIEIGEGFMTISGTVNQ